MSQNSNNQLVQPQLELSNSALLGKGALSHLLNVCLEDDVQPLISVIMESMGDSLLISRKRIETAQEIFLKTRSQPGYWPSRKLLKKVGLAVGVAVQGWPDLFSKSIGLIKTFLLATACQICYNDDEIASMLYEMMWLSKRNPNAPYLPEYNLRFVDAVSGYGHGLVPFEYYNRICAVVRTALPSHPEMIMLFERCNPEVIAKVLVDLFDALRDPNIARISLEGARGGCFLTAMLAWLLEEDIQCFMDSILVFGRNESKIVIRLVDRSGWYIGKWTVEERVDWLETPDSTHPMSIANFTPPSHTSYESAETQISVQCGYYDSHELRNSTGILAGAIVKLAYEKGVLYSSQSESSVLLRDICADKFVSSHEGIMRKYGWPVEDFDLSAFREQQREVASILKSWIKGQVTLRREFYTQESTFLDRLRREIMECNIHFSDYNSRPMLLNKVDQCATIIDSAIYLAGDALLRCFEEENNPGRRFRPQDESGIRNRAEFIFRMVFQPSINNDSPAYFQEFWLGALEESVPGYLKARSGDLAIAQGGYVAYAKVLDAISTDQRKACMISTVPGLLRKYGTDRKGPSSRASKVVEVTAGMPSSREFVGREKLVECFSPGTIRQYLGISAKPDQGGAKIRHLVDRSINVPEFRLTSELDLSSEPLMASSTTLILPNNESYQTSRYAPVSWVASIEAMAFATHIDINTDEVYVTPETERSLADSWRRNGLYQKMAWHQVGKFASQSKHNISMTDSDEELRFFEAGYLIKEGKLFVRHDVPLISCLKMAIEYSPSADYRWAIIA